MFVVVVLVGQTHRDFLATNVLQDILDPVVNNAQEKVLSVPIMDLVMMEVMEMASVPATKAFAGATAPNIYAIINAKMEVHAPNRTTAHVLTVGSVPTALRQYVTQLCARMVVYV